MDNNYVDDGNPEIEIVYDDYQIEKLPNGQIQLANCELKNLPLCDNLYHLSLNTKEYNFIKMFNDVKFVCMGGTKKRMYEFARLAAKELNLNDVNDDQLIDITASSNRFSMYKVGPIISISHGMGLSSISILLHEIFKLLYHAKCSNVTIFRVGTSGGIGVDPGTVVITKDAVDELLRPYYELNILGKIVRRPAKFNQNLITELKEIAASQNNNYETLSGTTMCTRDFYESQSRIDGSICNHTLEEKLKWLNKIKNKGVINIEMESLVFGSMSYYLNIDAAIVCVTLVNRLTDDQLALDGQTYHEYQMRPQKLVIDLIRKRLSSP